jgi:hypothetical protein
VGRPAGHRLTEQWYARTSGMREIQRYWASCIDYSPQQWVGMSLGCRVVACSAQHAVTCTTRRGSRCWLTELEPELAARS